MRKERESLKKQKWRIVKREAPNSGKSLMYYEISVDEAENARICEQTGHPGFVTLSIVEYWAPKGFRFNKMEVFSDTHYPYNMRTFAPTLLNYDD